MTTEQRPHKSILMTCRYPDLGGASDWSCRERNLLLPEAQTSGVYHLTKKSGWGVESIMVSDLPVYRRIATSVTISIQKRGEFV